MKIREELLDANKIAISGHIRPDGDCVGSCMGMYLYLTKIWPEKKIDVYLETPSEIFNCVKGVEKIKKADGTKHNYDACIAIDCNAERLGDAEPIFWGAKKRINIDHHVSNPGDGDVNYIVPGASSASELVYDVIEEDMLDVDIATAIYIGIIHDTGIMQYSSTAPKTLRIVAKLLEFGFDFPKLIEETFYQKTYIQNQVLGRTLMESTLMLDGRVIVGRIDQNEMRLYGVTSKDFDGIVNQLRYTKGVDIAVFMYELEPGTYKISMRSNGVIDCSTIAVSLGGGGHVRAAGVTIEGNYEKVIDEVLNRIKKQYD